MCYYYVTAKQTNRIAEEAIILFQYTVACLLSIVLQKKSEIKKNHIQDVFKILIYHTNIERSI